MRALPDPAPRARSRLRALQIRLALPALLLASLLLTGCGDSGCENVESAIGAVCLPASLAPEQAAVLDVREACGNGCASAPSCSAELISGALYLTLREDVCGASSAACLAEPCSQGIASCTLPALGPGDYPVVLGGGAETVLRVSLGGASACHLPAFPASDGGS